MKWGRAVGVDDGFFVRGRSIKAPIVFTVMKGSIVEGFRFGWASVDGDDVTEVIEEVLTSLGYPVPLLFLYGTIFAGTNVVNMGRLCRGRVVIAVSDEEPQEKRVKEAISVHGTITSLNNYVSNPELVPIATKRGRIWASWCGAVRREVVSAIEAYQFASRVPEPLRISHLVGRELGRWLLDYSTT